MDESDLRESVARILARYAPNAFSDRHATVVECEAEWPADYGTNEVGCFRTLAARVLDIVRPHLKAND